MLHLTRSERQPYTRKWQRERAKAFADAQGTWDEDEDEDVKCGIVPDEEWDQVREDITEERETNDREPSLEDFVE